MSFIADEVAKHPKLAKLVLALAVAGTTLSGLPSRADAGGIEDVPIIGGIFSGNRLENARREAQLARYRAQIARERANEAKSEAQIREYEAQGSGNSGMSPKELEAARKEELAEKKFELERLRLEEKIAQQKIRTGAIQEGLNGMRGGGAARLDDGGVPAPDRGSYADMVSRQRGAPPSNSPAEVEYGESQHPGSGNQFTRTYRPPPSTVPAPRGTTDLAPSGATDSTGWAALEKAVAERRGELGLGGGRGK